MGCTLGSLGSHDVRPCPGSGKYPLEGIAVCVVTDTELREAAKRVCKTVTAPPIEDAFDAKSVAVPRDAWLSALAVSCLVLADLNRRAAEEAERALPVDEDRLIGIGAVDRERLYTFRHPEGRFSVNIWRLTTYKRDESAWYVDVASGNPILMVGYTMGQVLDLLRALGVRS